MSEACQHCRFWLRRQLTGPDAINPRLQGLREYGKCRANPPIAGQDEWPNTHENAWCGRFEPLQRPSAYPSIGDTRPGAAAVEINDNGAITVTHHTGEKLELAALDGLSDQDRQVMERLVWS